jgi:hypothetical protein
MIDFSVALCYNIFRRVINMLKTKLFAAAAAVLILAANMAFAVYGAEAGQPGFDIRFIPETGLISVSGFLEKERPKQKVTLTVLAPETTPGDISGDGANAGDKLIHIRSAETDLNGRFAFSLEIAGKSGIYHFSVGSPDTENPVVINFAYANPNDAANAVKAFNSALSSGTGAEKTARLDAALSEWCAVGSSAFENIYYPAKYGGKNKTCELILAAYDKTGLFSADNFPDIYNTQIINQVNKSEISEAFIDYGGFLNLENSAKMYPDYEKLSDADKKSLIGELFGGNFTNLSEIRSEFADRAVCYTLKEMVFTAAAVPTLIERAGAELGWAVDTAKYTGQDSVNKKLIGVLKTKAEILNILNTGETALPPKGGNGGFSGGSAGGGSSGNVISQIKTGPLAEIPPPSPKPENVFSDLDGVPWAKEYIEFLADKGVINGKTAGIFAPYDNVTRVEFVKMLTEALGLVDETAETEFSDTAPDMWHYKYIASAQKAGITIGIGEKLFGPDSAVTRRDMAVMAYRAVSVSGISLKYGGDSDFFDNELIGEYAKTAVNALSAAGVLNGMGGNIFSPLLLSTRAEAAAVIYRILML